MSRAITSAPGKLVLLGEHAVVYDRPCLVAAIDQHLTVDVQTLVEPVLKIDASAFGLADYEKPFDQVGQEPTKCTRYLESAIAKFVEQHPVEGGLSIKTDSGIDSRFGFGTSAAVTVATISALRQLAGKGFDPKEIFRMSYQAITNVAGSGSGADVAASTYGGVVEFVTGGKKIEPLIEIEDLNPIVGFSGNSADTPTILNSIRDRRSSDDRVEEIFDDIGKLVEQGRGSLLENDLLALGETFNANHDLLCQLGVSTPELDKLCSIARNSGAHGAKLSGAGGGDCMIAVAPSRQEESVLDAMRSDGFEATKVAVTLAGVRSEVSAQ